MARPRVIPLRSYSDMGMTSPLRTPDSWAPLLSGYTRWLRGADYPHTTERLRLYHLKRFAITTELAPLEVTTDLSI